jgi:hypothetical protein
VYFVSVSLFSTSKAVHFKCAIIVATMLKPLPMPSQPASSLRDEFRDAMSVLRDFVLRHARAKELGGRFVNGAMLVQVRQLLAYMCHIVCTLRRHLPCSLLGAMSTRSMAVACPQ